jgi:hypothetical protein
VKLGQLLYKRSNTSWLGIGDGDMAQLKTRIEGRDVWRTQLEWVAIKTVVRQEGRRTNKRWKYGRSQSGGGATWVQVASMCHSYQTGSLGGERR